MSKMLFAILSFILAIGIFFFYTKPAYTGPGTTDHPSVLDMKAHIAQYDNALEKVAQLEQTKAKLQAKYNSFNPDDLTRLQALLPDHVDNIGLILELDSLASKYGMALQNVDVSDTADTGGQTVAVGDTTGVVADAQSYASLKLTFSTTGTYDKFNLFLQDLESSLRIVDLDALKFQATGSAGGDPIYNYDMTIKTYWLK
jgi:Tfp pilus assembly protein PilO